MDVNSKSGSFHKMVVPATNHPPVRNAWWWQQHWSLVRRPPWSIIHSLGKRRARRHPRSLPLYCKCQRRSWQQPILEPLRRRRGGPILLSLHVCLSNLLLTLCWTYNLLSHLPRMHVGHKSWIFICQNQMGWYVIQKGLFFEESAETKNASLPWILGAFQLLGTSTSNSWQ